MVFRCLFVLWIAALAAAPAVRAQFATVRGLVTDGGDGQPLPGVHVTLRAGDGRFFGTATSADGFFILNRIPPDRYAFEASFVGYRPLRDTLDLGFDAVRVLSLALEHEAQRFDEVVVEAGDAPPPGGPTAGLEAIRGVELERVPMPGVAGDLMGFLLTMPGIITAGDRGGQLFVRGGTPTQNHLLVDGMPLYQPFHIVGFYSAFPAELVAHADVYAGGFGARYGGRLSSVIDVATRNGNKQRLAGSASVSPLLGTLLVEGPFLPGRVSLILSARESLLRRAVPLGLQRHLPYHFGDRFAKLHAFLGPTSHLALTALQTFDEGDLADARRTSNRVAWRNRAFGGRYLYLPAEFPVLADLSFSISSLDSEFGPAGRPDRTASVSGFNGALTFLYLLGAYELRFGLFGQTMAFAYDLGRTFREEGEYVTETASFIEAALPLGRALRLEPGLRLHAYPSRSGTRLEPRFRGVWRPGRRHQLSAAWGSFHQEIIGLNDERDVGDVFTAWAPSPQNRPIPSSTHLIFGWQSRVQPWLELSAEVYRKRFDNLAVLAWSGAQKRPLGFELVHGLSRGLDVRAELNRPSFYGFLGYGLQAVRYQTEGSVVSADGRTLVDRAGERFAFRPPHDRRHAVQAFARLARDRFAFTARWTYGSGLPFTRVIGFDEWIEVGAPDRSFHTDPGTLRLLFDRPYEGTLPAYHRLDLAAEMTLRYRRVRATLKAEVVNAYDRANLYYYDALTGRRMDQLPLVPTVGLKVGME